MDASGRLDSDYLVKLHEDPTSRADEIAAEVRTWYENNRESWWSRHKFLPWHASPDRYGEHADEFMLGLVAEVRRLLRDRGVR